MLQWLADKWHALTWESIVISVILFVVTFAFSLGAIAFVLVKLPAHYFSAHYEQDFLPNSPWLVRWGAVILKNILGVFLIFLGILLSLPGVPGQGILTILLGLIMLDVPGKRPLEARIIKRPKVLAAANHLRARWGKPPLEMD
ncbi:MAG: hypothetical protein JSS77_00955 [Acidobacteria bacterium]|nr:hypothetical protein [Acidobacteriota bacterium]HMM78522.1 hypothetical protein [Pyrinomonadaceae bacterium]HMU34517.1 hypothetical protein [Pyrinomonadaceae bacterium]